MPEKALNMHKNCAQYVKTGTLRVHIQGMVESFSIRAIVAYLSDLPDNSKYTIRRM